MAGFLTDSDDEKAVEEILSQAMDSTVLEQVAAINCAGLTDSALPSHLETRFQKLKSFPSSAKASSFSATTFDASDHSEFKKSDSFLRFSESSDKGPTTCLKKCRPEKNGSSCLQKSSENWGFSPVEKNPRRKMCETGSKSDSSSSEEDFSAQKKSGCFWCSPKKASRKKSKDKRDLKLEHEWRKNDEFLSDLSNFSVKSQRRMMKKAMEEEENISREAEKIVKWAKHASARMDVSCIEDELSDHDNSKSY